MVKDIFSLVYAFNKDAGLLSTTKGHSCYDDFLESSFQVEEALEGFDLVLLAQLLEVQPPYKAKQISRAIVSEALRGQSKIMPNELTDVDRLDKACDAIVFALGSMFKLGLTEAQAKQALEIVMKKNLQKLTMPKDEHGKLLKPDNFEGPETELQALLDSRG